jgi:transcriptional regulator with XRE-family HTH domain
MPTPETTARLVELIELGKTQREIAADIGVEVSTINRWIHASDELAEQSARARVLSAEAWTDRGLQALEDAPPDAVEIARARAIEQHCARRAAIRNPAYREGHNVAATGTLAITWPVSPPAIELSAET